MMRPIQYYHLHPCGLGVQVPLAPPIMGYAQQLCCHHDHLGELQDREA